MTYFTRATALILLLGTGAALAHGDQEITYLGSECRLRGDFERGTTNAGCSGTPRGTPWRNLQGISMFGAFANLNRCNRAPGSPPSVPFSPAPDMSHRNIGDMFVTCPIPRGAIRKGSGIQAFIKVETVAEHINTLQEPQQINRNLRCELININANGTGAQRRDTTTNEVASTSGQFEAGKSVIHTLQLSLPASNASSDGRALDSGGYVINCILPGMQQDSDDRDRFSRIIHYTVREAD
ncbi:MAG: hypothetical protein AAGA87_16840 [Pseudomonadota bacterium]